MVKITEQYGFTEAEIIVEHRDKDGRLKSKSVERVMVKGGEDGNHSG
jgi:hypothetical protein